MKMIDADWLTPYGAWSPLRALFENSFLALWILHPETSEERVKNGLAMVLDEHRQHGIRLGIYHRLHESASPSTEELADMEKTKELHARIVADFNKLGAPYGLSIQSTGASVTAQIQQSRVFSDEGKGVAELVWRMASSLQHGDTAALYTTSKTTPTEASQTVTVQFDPDSFLSAYHFTLDLFSRAIGEMVMRSTTESPATPPSATKKVKRPRKKQTQDGTGRTTR
ncbi:hypothetical protein PACID_22850 [Acidipropionibacterium acidipropionici ATCC 4875]|uniref:Uncharacterized protein n=1 Tax=Acidipropionibacterium acidipropionici (strain ATCC 4875 / DSM 20272 / JCM 6432 / NBRC 12425 / NCIMB 8070 / 4) TaxID=1171373 RepID=K7RYI4_ACIA4|nr:hypothetical protein PACID_22850 [Acidipropionibacterium acidipropionici ATCC 4875]